MRCDAFCCDTARGASGNLGVDREIVPGYTFGNRLEMREYTWWRGFARHRAGAFQKCTILARRCNRNRRKSVYLF